MSVWAQRTFLQATVRCSPKVRVVVTTLGVRMHTLSGRKCKRLAVAVSVAFALASRPLSGEEPNDRLPRTRMTATAYETLRSALETCQFHESRRAVALKRNGEALEHLREVPWPDLRKLERVRLYDLRDEKRFFNAWRLPGEREPMVIVTPWLRVEQVPSCNFSKVEVIDYAEELKELLRLVRAADAQDKEAYHSTIAGDSYDSPWPVRAGIYHACEAALLGKQDTAKSLVHYGLRTGDYFPHIYDNWAFQDFYRGIELLENGGPRQEVLAAWEKSLSVYPHSQYREQLLDYIARLRKQIEQDTKLLATSVDNPEKLPLDERIAYYIARFPDVRGYQALQPGHCQTIGLGGPTEEYDTSLSDAIVQIGRPAVPMLVDHLTDRRLTRSVGFFRNFAPSRTVLRVQDVAVQCIERILMQGFYSPSSTSSYLSNESPEKREQIISDIKAWWKENG